ncbi:MAG: DEAD/DEAH box helicase family protein [Vicinamibacterales bacterium]
MLPARYEFDHANGGLRVCRLLHQQQEVRATVLPFQSRGPQCRRLVAAVDDGQQIIIELAPFNERYDVTITGVVRARSAAVANGLLSLGDATFRNIPFDLTPFADTRQQVFDAWGEGIRYRETQEAGGGRPARPGLRRPQIGALHAIASHWTVEREPALVIMPTGTGKTEVMMAAAVASQCNRLLLVVPTDALRTQTADKFLSYGLLQSIGIIDAIPGPVVGVLESAPSEAHMDGLRACNVIVTTMSSIGLATLEAQQQFAALFSHAFFDEAHHVEATTWKKFRKHCQHARVILFTATPYREDGKPVDGRIIYEFPLSAAQEQGYFRPIRFIEVFEPDEARGDRAIADAAVTRLREDLAAGRDHLLMARAGTIDGARRLYETIYRPLYADLNPVLIHSRTPGKRAVLSSIRSGTHRIIVCVNMFGEGFDLPSLKVAALHTVHKSLGVTLQFIGRFARSAQNVGEATFVANTADDGVPEALESLYVEDSDWNALIADLSYDAINPQAQLSALVANLRRAAGAEDSPDISTLALRPKISTQVYRTAAFRPERFARAFRPSQKIHHPQISQRDRLLVLVVNQPDTIDWTDSREIITDSWDLYIAYYDPARQFLYVHCSRKGNATAGLAKAVAEDPQLVHGEDVFKTFARLQRLILHSVGLTSRSRNVRYQMFAGLDVRNAIDPVLQQDKMKSNVTGVGYENGKRHTVGCSRKGKIWSMASGSLAQWKSWCDEIGAKLADANTQPNDFLRFTLVPSLITALPDSEALLVDWPDQLFEAWNFRFEVRTAAGQTHDFHDCQLDLRVWTPAAASFQFALRAGEDAETVLELRIEAGVNGNEGTYSVHLVGGITAEIETAGNRWDAATFFTENPPLVRLADGSQLAGNILLKPREELADTFDRGLVEALDWTGVDFTKESRWKDGALREDSIQQRFVSHLDPSLATFIIDDDDTGESADLIAIEETNDTITVFLWHCKYAHGATPGERASDLYELCGQAAKSVKWTWSLATLVKHLVKRESAHGRGRPSRFLRGTASQLVTLRKSARKKFVVFRVGIVQPGFSRANAPAEHIAIIGSTNSFIQTVTGYPMLVCGSA